MELFRVFDWDGTALGRREGGPLFVARQRQGAGRHDAPGKFGAWYCSRQAVSAVGESIQYLRGHVLQDSDFLRFGGTTKALVRLSLEDAVALIDLDDPAELAARGLRPSRVATPRRTATQTIAVSIFEEGAGGFLWWSTLDADWTNATLFHERVLAHVSILERPKKLTTRLVEVRQAAEHLGMTI